MLVMRESVDVPFLITTNHIHHPIVVFNAIRHTAKESSDFNFLNKLFEKAFNNTDISKIEAFVICQSYSFSRTRERSCENKGKGLHYFTR